MKRPVKPAAKCRTGYPSLEVGRRILRGAALAASLLVAMNAMADASLPDGGKAKIPRPSGGPPTPSLKGEVERPVPPCPGVPPRVVPPKKEGK